MARTTKSTTPAAPVGMDLTAAEAMALRIQTATAWRPAVNETIKGTLVKIVKREAEYGPYPCLILDTGDADGFKAVHAFHGVLLNQLREARPASGDVLTILYAGKRAANKRTDSQGNAVEYHGYALFVNNADSSEEWDMDAEVTTPATPAVTAAPARKAATARKTTKAPTGAEEAPF